MRFADFDGTGFATIETFETSHGNRYPDPNAAGNPAAYFSSSRDLNGHDGRTRRALALLLWVLRGANAATEFDYRGRVYWKRASAGVPPGETSQAWTVNGVVQGNNQTTSTNPAPWTITDIVFENADGDVAHYRYTGTAGEKLDSDSYRYWTEVVHATPVVTTTTRGGASGAPLWMWIIEAERRRKRRKYGRRK